MASLFYPLRSDLRSVAGRGHAGLFAEEPRKVVLVFETEEHGDFADGEAWIGQQGLGIFYDMVVDMLQGGLSGALFEGLAEVFGRDLELSSDLGHRRKLDVAFLGNRVVQGELLSEVGDDGTLQGFRSAAGGFDVGDQVEEKPEIGAQYEFDMGLALDFMDDPGEQMGYFLVLGLVQFCEVAQPELFLDQFGIGLRKQVVVFVHQEVIAGDWAVEWPFDLLARQADIEVVPGFGFMGG